MTNEDFVDGGGRSNGGPRRLSSGVIGALVFDV